MTLSKVLVILGLLLLITSGYLFSQRYSSSKLEFKNFEASATLDSNVKPVRIIIPTLGINNGIFEAQIRANKWDSTTKGISYLSSSPVPGESGNSILYGHNFPTILGNLKKIKPGEKIEVELSNGEKRAFVVKYSTIVEPTETSILSQTDDKRITIYTCTGFLDSKRFVATAVLVK